MPQGLHRTTAHVTTRSLQFHPTKDEWEKLEQDLFHSNSSGKFIRFTDVIEILSQYLKGDIAHEYSPATHSVTLQPRPIPLLLARKWSSDIAPRTAHDESTPVMRLFDAMSTNSTKVKHAIQTTTRTGDR